MALRPWGTPAMQPHGERIGNSATSGARQSAGSSYLLDNAGKEAPVRFAALSALFDSGTIRHLEDRGVASGWHCLEVGGGSGSIASWLADRVGPTGRVLVTDIDPRFLESLQLPNLEVRRHDIGADPLPKAAFDLVHSRLVLLHVPEREKALARMIEALKPGGWLIDEEYDSTSMLPDPAVSPGEVLLKAQVAVARLLDDRGAERRLGRLLFGRLRAHGLVCVGAEARVFMLQGGSPTVSALRANYEQLRTAMIDANYLTEQEFDEDLARLDDPGFLMPSGILWAAWGRRP
jgi:SAM-dependent methyltransferase